MRLDDEWESVLDFRQLTEEFIRTGLVHFASDTVPEPGQKEYSSFVDVWLQLYRKVKPFIDEHEADLNGFPYKIRVLDGLLWYLGKDDFYVRSNDMRA